jgi:hypothetical protein
MRRRRGFGLGCLVLAGAACASGSGPPRAAPPATHPVTSSSSSSSSTTTSGPVRIAVTVERRVRDGATEDFPAVVRATLTDPRGWQAAGFEFVFADDGPYHIVLGEGPEVDRLCRPYDTGGRFSCQNGPVVALNAQRWRTATPQWTGDLDTYRRMLVNHEVGHLLGQHHPAIQCPRPGEPAPVMAQQSTELAGCLPNPWPLRWERDCAARHVEPVAPGYEDHPTSRCGPEASGAGGR